MLKTYFQKKNIQKKAIFTLTISSTNEETLQDLNPFGGDLIGLNVEAVTVNHLQCLLIDQLLFDRLDLKPFLGDDGNQQTIEIYSDEYETKLIERLKGYELMIHYKTNGILGFVSMICTPYQDILKDYGVYILYGRNTDYHEID